MLWKALFMKAFVALSTEGFLPFTFLCLLFFLLLHTQQSFSFLQINYLRYLHLYSVLDIPPVPGHPVA
jgi:hypothetical protein